MLIFTCFALMVCFVRMSHHHLLSNEHASTCSAPCSHQHPSDSHAVVPFTPSCLVINSAVLPPANAFGQHSGKLLFFNVSRIGLMPSKSNAMICVFYGFSFLFTSLVLFSSSPRCLLQMLSSQTDC